MYLKLTEEQLARMKHALGMDNISPRDYSYHAYRNYSVYSDPHPVWEELVTLGLAIRRVNGRDFMTSYVYNVSQQGMQEVANATGLLIKYTLEFEPKEYIIEEGKWYKCIFVEPGVEYGLTKGKCYKAVSINGEVTFRNDCNTPLAINGFKRYFHPAKPDEINETIINSDDSRACCNCVNGACNYYKCSCWQHKCCNTDTPYVIMREDWVETAEKCENFEPEHK